MKFWAAASLLVLQFQDQLLKVLLRHVEAFLAALVLADGFAARFQDLVLGKPFQRHQTDIVDHDQDEQEVIPLLLSLGVSRFEFHSLNEIRGEELRRQQSQEDFHRLQALNDLFFPERSWFDQAVMPRLNQFLLGHHRQVGLKNRFGVFVFMGIAQERLQRDSVGVAGFLFGSAVRLVL